MKFASLLTCCNRKGFKLDAPSLSQLQALLTNRSSEADNIKADLDKARSLLDSCYARLAKLVGGTKEGQKSLKTFIKGVLNSSNEPLTVREIAEFVLEAGYKTTSAKNFRNMVQQALITDAEFKRKTRPKTRPARYAVEEV